jgi:hypothetical protein
VIRRTWQKTSVRVTTAVRVCETSIVGSSLSPNHVTKAAILELPRPGSIALFAKAKTVKLSFVDSNAFGRRCVIVPSAVLSSFHLGVEEAVDEGRHGRCRAPS